MKVVVAGGSGFLGRALVDRLASGGHEVIVLSRHPRPGGVPRVRTESWNPDGTAGSWASEIDGANAVVNLAGEGIAERRWTSARKRSIEQSRLSSTRSLVAAVARAAAPPRVFISGSGIGYYGDTGDRAVTETDPPGSDVLARLCVAWEAEAQAAEAAGCRVSVVRTGIVLATEGGALAKLLPPFQWFVGGPIGSGRQYMPWIHRDDWVSLILWLIERHDAGGPFNAASPNPVTNRDFATALGHALGRPSLLPVPAFALRLLVGEIADIALLAGQRALPAHALSLGFSFRCPTLDAALAAVFSPGATRSQPDQRRSPRTPEQP